MRKWMIAMQMGLLLAFSGCTNGSNHEKTLKTYIGDSYVTTGSKSKLLQKEASLTIRPGGEEDAPGVFSSTIRIDPTILYQEMDGFGAAMTESSAFVIQSLSLETRNALMEELFATEGLAIRFLRVPMGASDFALNNYSYNDIESGSSDPMMNHFSLERDEDYVIPVLKEAKRLRPDLLLMASPWSAPAWMKTNGSMNGGSLRPEYYLAYARYFTQFIRGYESHGLPIYAITLQNEPLHETFSYPSMKMTASEQIELLKVVGPHFASENIPVKILAYDHNWDNTAYPKSILGNPLVSGYVAGSAFHCYGGNVEAQDSVHRSYPEKGIWFTECSGGRWATDFASNLSWNMQHVFIGSINNHSKSVLLWNLALDENDGPQNGGCPNCRGVITVRSDGTVQKNEEFYLIGHFSKFLSSGARRIHSEVIGNASNVLATAFRNSNGELVAVIHNKATAPFNVELDIGGSKGYYALPSRGIATIVIREQPQEGQG